MDTTTAPTDYYKQACACGARPSPLYIGHTPACVSAHLSK